MTITPTIEVLPGSDPGINLATEEAHFNALRDCPASLLLFYVNSPCVVLGRSNRVEEWANEAALEADGIPLLRRFSGGGAVYHDLSNLNYSFMLPRELLSRWLPGGSHGPADYIRFFIGLVIRALRRSGQEGYEHSGVSDISLHGRKVSGNAQRISRTMVMHHGTLLLRCPLDAIERYLCIPPNRPGIPHRGFVSGLHDEGRMHSMNQLQDWLSAEFNELLGG